MGEMADYHDPEPDDQIGEVVYDDGANTYRLRGQAGQDYADGAALRRLREALPEKYVASVHFGGDEDPDGDTGMVMVLGPDEYVTAASAPTIAEAADKCREVLAAYD